MIRNRLRDERGWTLVTATILMTIMLSVGLATLSLVDADNNRTRNDREAESALNLDEGVLYAQSLVLAQRWPISAPATSVCTNASTDPICPSAANLAGTGGSANFTNVDQQQGATWRTKIRDNGGDLATAYDPAKADLSQPGCALAGPCTWDANGDDEMWVQAQAIVRGQPRNVVARLRREELRENTPEVGVVAGALNITNNGNHGGTPIIDAEGSEVIVRCASGDCVQAQPNQVVPSPTSKPGAPSFMTPTQLARFKARAIADGRYYAGCPTVQGGAYDLSGKVVWVEGCTSPPAFANKVITTPCAPPNNMATKCINTEAEPGMLIWHCGRADFSGGMTYRGVLYLVNNSDGTCAPPLGPGQKGDLECSKQAATDPDNDVLTTTGGFGVWGSVAVDGPGCLKLGSNGLQVKFDRRVFQAVQSYGTVGLVQNTWRELPPKAF